MITHFLDLSEEEKESDRREADRFIAILQRHKVAAPDLTAIAAEIITEMPTWRTLTEYGAQAQYVAKIIARHITAVTDPDPTDLAVAITSYFGRGTDPAHWYFVQEVKRIIDRYTDGKS